jgi:glyoxylase-like metal-dependent hydrolase (beta-lactamase superfamily II)
MKKITGLLFILLIALSTFAQNRETPPVRLDRISDNLYQVSGGRGANGGMYIGDDEVLIIDSKMDKASVDGIYKAVLKITDKPITYLVNTHSDGDHINGNLYFPKSVTIVAHKNCREEFFHPSRDGSPSEWLNADRHSFVPEITFTDKMNLYLGEKVVQLYYFGVGHTTGDIVVYFPEEKTAFIGDQVFLGRPQLIHSYKGGNSFEHVKTTQRMLDELDAEKFCSGHAEIMTRADIESHIKKMAAFQEKIKSLVANGKSLEEVQAAFEENEARLAESVYNEVAAMQ